LKHGGTEEAEDKHSAAEPQPETNIYAEARRRGENLKARANRQSQNFNTEKLRRAWGTEKMIWMAVRNVRRRGHLYPSSRSCRGPRAAVPRFF